MQTSAQRRRTAAAFLLLEEDDPSETPEPVFTFQKNLQLNPPAKHLATSFSGHGPESGAIVEDVKNIFSHPTETSVWAKLMTDVAVTANFGALILTFLGAAYHCYGYVQLRNAQKQASRSQGGGHGHRS